MDIKETLTRLEELLQASNFVLDSIPVEVETAHAMRRDQETLNAAITHLRKYMAMIN